MEAHKSTNVYIVDDSDSIRQRLVSILESIDGVAVVGQAGNASDAIAGILATHPDSVLLDLNLGGGSGLEMLKTLHQQLPIVKFVILTNHSEPQYRRACARAGAEYFLDKSTEFDTVRNIIAGIAAGHPIGRAL